jgi:hypothetical protein
MCGEMVDRSSRCGARVAGVKGGDRLVAARDGIAIGLLGGPPGAWVADEGAADALVAAEEADASGGTHPAHAVVRAGRVGASTAGKGRPLGR